MKKPSLTELLDLLNKPALISWANKQGLAGIDINESRKKSMMEGSSIHKQIEDFETRQVPFLEKYHQDNYLRFMQGKQHLFCEQNVETDFFVGRCDFGFKENGKIILADFKRNQKYIYLENKLQLVGYGMAIECDGFAIVSVPDFTTITVDIKDRSPYIEIIKSLSTIYYTKKHLENVY